MKKSVNILILSLDEYVDSWRWGRGENWRQRLWDLWRLLSPWRALLFYQGQGLLLLEFRGLDFDYVGSWIFWAFFERGVAFRLDELSFLQIIFVGLAGGQLQRRVTVRYLILPFFLILLKFLNIFHQGFLFFFFGKNDEQIASENVIRPDRE